MSWASGSAGSPLGEVAKRLGLVRTAKSWFRAESARGSVRGFAVWVRTESSPWRQELQITVEGGGRIPEAIAIYYPSVQSAFYRRHPTTDWTRDQIAFLNRANPSLYGAGGARIEVGDPRFDPIHVKGDARFALALLDRDNRDRLQRAIPRFRLALFVGRLRGFVDISVMAPALEEAILELVDLAQALSMTEAELPDRYAANVARDPLPVVQAANLRRLIADHPYATQTGSACRTALDAADAGLRLAAARHLGVEAIGVACAIVADLALPEDLRRRALDAVAAIDRAGDRYAGLVADLLADPVDPLRGVAIAAVEKLRRPGWIDRLVAVAPTADGPTAVALANALGEWHGARIEEDLLRCLEDAEGADKLRVVRALGRVGTARSVETLLEATRGMWAGRIGNAAQAAIADIQQRLGAVDAGRLSLSNTDKGGALSQSEADGGLSVAEPPDRG